MELDQLWEVADRARNRAKVSQEDSTGTFVRCASLIAERVLGARYKGSDFYESIEKGHCSKGMEVL